MRSEPLSCAVRGEVVWDAPKSLWTGAMSIVALIGGPLTASPGALALFVVTTGVTLCLGHSVGLHRLLIHRSFEVPRWLERTLVYLGTLVGMAGPIGMIRAHDIRDWAQRQRTCHDLFAHRRSPLIDMWWQMHCGVRLVHPPRFVVEERVAQDWFYGFLERTWMLQQLPWAVLFYVMGGLPFVIWGIAVRIAVSLTGHWLVGHLAHRGGHQGWRIEGVAVQGYNVRHVGLITFGESWHGNHHAFPESARLGVEPGQADPGWWFITAMARLGLATHVREPGQGERREGLQRVEVPVSRAV
jgi:stearoyl-CoA desaturase (delta-9 desaturase)